MRCWQSCSRASLDLIPMGKVWVLDTETKGTGAEIRPLEKADDRARKGGQSPIVVRERKQRPRKGCQSPDGRPRPQAAPAEAARAGRPAPLQGRRRDDEARPGRRLAA